MGGLYHLGSGTRGRAQLLPQHFCAWLALPQELDAIVPVATGFGAITVRLAVAQAPCAPHQVAGHNQHQRHLHLRHLQQVGSQWQELVVARIPHAEATCSSEGNCQIIQSQVARPTVRVLEGCMRPNGKTTCPTAGVTVHAIAPTVIHRAIASATRRWVYLHSETSLILLLPPHNNGWQSRCR